MEYYMLRSYFFKFTLYLQIYLKIKIYYNNFYLIDTPEQIYYIKV